MLCKSQKVALKPNMELLVTLGQPTRSDCRTTFTSPVGYAVRVQKHVGINDRYSLMSCQTVEELSIAVVNPVYVNNQNYLNNVHHCDGEWDEIWVANVTTTFTIIKPSTYVYHDYVGSFLKLSGELLTIQS